MSHWGIVKIQARLSLSRGMVSIHGIPDFTEGYNGASWTSGVTMLLNKQKNCNLDHKQSPINDVLGF